MKKVSTLKAALSKSKSNTSIDKKEEGRGAYGTSILGNIRHSDFGVTKGLVSLGGLLGKGVNRAGSFRRKDKGNESIDEGLDRGGKMTYLAPPMPPTLATTRLRRVNSSTLSLNRSKKKLLTLDELYVEILYTVLYMIGCDKHEISELDLIAHVQAAFHMEEDKHQELLHIARMKEEPYLKLNIEIHSARKLIGKDISGNSDPFCTFYLTTNPHARYNTSYKPRTLNPNWNEDFVLDVNSIEQDNLRVDVWDFNPDENITDKIKRINEVKDGRGLRKFIKDTLHAGTGKISHDLLGSVEVPLKTIPASGVSGWWSLEKPETRKQRDRGDIHLSLTLSTEKDQCITTQEHRHLLRILFAYELQQANAAPFTWNGEFSKQSITILAQHAVQGKLTGADTALARWLVYCHTHCDLPLDYRVFIPILEKILFALENNIFHSEEEAKFVEVSLIFVNHGVEFIRKHRHFLASDPEYINQLEAILKCLNIVKECLQKAGDNENEVGNDILEKVEEAATSSIQDWYNFILDKMPIENNKSMRVKNLNNLANLLGQDVRDGSTGPHNLFQDAFGLNYKAICYKIYAEQLCDLCRDFVEETCEQLRPVIYSEMESDREYVNNTITIGTGLFELYLALQTFARLGEEYAPDEDCHQQLSGSHVWFNKAVPRWLDIALYKAMQRIMKAVELDDLAPVDELVKHSSSAVDIRTVLMQIKTFWAQLAWPEVEASYAFISKILDDVCKTTIYYADKMIQKVSSRGENNNETYEIKETLCMAINNIDYLLQYIQPFVNDLGYDTTLAGLETLNGDMVAASCRRTLSTLVENAMENVENKILEVLEEVGERMGPVIKEFLMRSASLVTYAGRDCKENLLNYLDKNLIMLKEKLTDRNFERILGVIWDCSAQTLENTIYVCIESKKPPSYFKTLCDVLKVLIKFFYGDKVPNDETLGKMRNLLQLYASDTTDLIAKYYWHRIREQRSLQAGEYSLGSVTLRAQLLREHLRVEVLNARHLKPPEIHRGSLTTTCSQSKRLRSKSQLNMSRSQKHLDWVKSKFSSLKNHVQEAQVQIHTANTQGQADPYVSIRLVPAVKFQDCPKLRTRTQRATLYPLFDETFDIVVSSANQRLRDAYLLITVKDRGLMGQGIFLGEAFLPLQEILEHNMDRQLKDLPQLQLPLTRPQDQSESDMIMALDSRIYDKHAKDFLKRERRKL